MYAIRSYYVHDLLFLVPGDGHVLWRLPESLKREERTAEHVAVVFKSLAAISVERQVSIE